MMLWTVGHSNRPLADFLALLAGNGIERVADVRAFPRSRTNPQFNGDTLPASLPEAGLDYVHLPRLGGRRRTAKDRARSPNRRCRAAGRRKKAVPPLTPTLRSGCKCPHRAASARGDARNVRAHTR